MVFFVVDLCVPLVGPQGLGFAGMGPDTVLQYHHLGKDDLINDTSILNSRMVDVYEAYHEHLF
jgi:hypothetical protein